MLYLVYLFFVAIPDTLTVPAFVKNLALESIGEASYGNIISNIKELEEKYDQLAREVGRIERDLALLMKRMKKIRVL